MGRLKEAVASFRSSAEQQQFLRFLIVGTGNTLFAYALYALGLLAGLPFQLASLGSLLISVVISFLTQGRLVFRLRLDGRFAHYAAAWALLYFANITLIRLLNWVGLDYYLAGLAAALPVTAMSFAIQRSVIFAREMPSPRIVIPAALLILLAFARLDLVLRFEVNWDEFLNLAMVHDYARGTLREVLQTGFVHLFGWVPLVSANEVDQVVAARLLVFVFAVAASFAIFAIARRIMDLPAALVAVFAFNTFTFVMRNGSPLRTDPLAACLMTVAIAVALARDFGRRHAVVVGVLCGLSGFLTIKAVFYVPTIGALLLLRIAYSAERVRAFVDVTVAALIALATFVIASSLHAATFPETASASAFVARTSGTLLFSGDYSITLSSLRGAGLANFGFWALALVGLGSAASLVRDPARRHEGLTLLALTLPLLSLTLYRDVYPYFFPFILPPIAVLAGYGFSRLYDGRNRFYARLLLATMIVSASICYVQSLRQDLDSQRRVLTVVHDLFPSPVGYIDHTSMVSTFPKQGFFMSRWGMTDYRAAGHPVMARVIRDTQPRFLLVTRALLDVEGMDPARSQQNPLGLLADDVSALQRSYLRYWGPIYLPGFRLPVSGTQHVEIAGPYRLDATSAVTINDRLVSPGQTIDLEIGAYTFRAPAAAELRWAASPPPQWSAPEELFHGF